MCPSVKPKIKSRKSSRKKSSEPRVYRTKTQNFGEGQGRYTQIRIGKRKIWVTSKGAKQIQEGLKLGKTENELYKVARQFSAKSQADKKATFKTNLDNALKATEITDAEYEEMTKIVESMDDNEISRWAEDNKDYLEEVLDYKPNNPMTADDIQKNKAERTQIVRDLIDSFKHAKTNTSIFD